MWNAAKSTPGILASTSPCKCDGAISLFACSRGFDSVFVSGSLHCQLMQQCAASQDVFIRSLISAKTPTKAENTEWTPLTRESRCSEDTDVVSSAVTSAFIYDNLAGNSSSGCWMRASRWITRSKKTRSWKCWEWTRLEMIQVLFTPPEMLLHAQLLLCPVLLLGALGNRFSFPGLLNIKLGQAPAAAG